MSALAEEQAYFTLKDMIVRADLKPGARLVHRKLAKELGMSPVPVVLALRLLEQDGLVINVPGLGAYVRTWNRAELIDLFRIRASQEALAAQFCAERASRIDMAGILTANDNFEAATDAEDIEASIRTDVEFHRAVVLGAHCPYLENLLGNLSIIGLSINMLFFHLKVPAFGLDPGQKLTHRAIIEAIESKDAAAAGHAASSHVEHSLEINLKWFDENAALLAELGGAVA